MSEFKGTKGVWKLGNNFSNIISDKKTHRPSYSKKDFETEKKYYGGYIITESISKKADAELIAEAGNVRQKINCSLTELLQQHNEMLETLQQAQGMLNNIRCVNTNCDGKGAIQISEDDWEPCQWCDEKQRIKRIIKKIKLNEEAENR